jgi:hypothetical protein
MINKHRGSVKEDGLEVNTEILAYVYNSSIKYRRKL